MFIFHLHPRQQQYTYSVIGSSNTMNNFTRNENGMQTQIDIVISR